MLAGSEVCKTCVNMQKYYVREIAEARLNLIIKDTHYYKDFDIFSEFVQNEITPNTLKLRIFSVIREKNIMSICLTVSAEAAIVSCPSLIKHVCG